MRLYFRFLLTVGLITGLISTAQAEPKTSGPSPGGSCAGVGNCGADGSNCTSEWPQADCATSTGSYRETCEGYRWCKNKQTGSSEGGVKAFVGGVDQVIDDTPPVAPVTTFPTPGTRFPMQDLTFLTGTVIDQPLAVKASDGHQFIADKKIFYLSEKQTYVECVVNIVVNAATRATATCLPYPKIAVLDGNSDSPVNQAVYDAVMKAVTDQPELFGVTSNGAPSKRGVFQFLKFR